MSIRYEYKIRNYWNFSYLFLSIYDKLNKKINRKNNRKRNHLRI